jgi:hypothetical protein
VVHDGPPVFGVVAAPTVPPGTIAAPEAGDTNTPDGFLSRAQAVLDSVPQGIHVISSGIFDRVVKGAPQLKSGAALTAAYATDVADAALVSFADKTLQAMRGLGVKSDQIDAVTQGLNEYWSLDAGGRPVKNQGGGAEFLRRVIRSDPKFQRAAQSALNTMGVTRLYDQLNKTSKVMLWLAALGTYAHQAELVSRTSSTVNGRTINGVAVNIPGVGYTVVDDLGLRNLNTSVSGTLARVGVRQRPVSANMRVDHRRGDGTRISTGFTVPVARRSQMELALGTEQTPASRRVLNMGLSYSTPISPTSQIMARAGISSSVRADPRGRGAELASNPSVTLGLSGPLPTFSRRVNQERRNAVRRRNEQDEMARAIVTGKSKTNPETGRPWTYSQVMALSYHAAQEVYLGLPASSSAVAMKGSRAVTNQCLAWVDYYRTFRKPLYNPEWYTAYENADVDLQDQCARDLDVSMEIDAYRRNPRDHKEYWRLKKQFHQVAKATQLPSTLKPPHTRARMRQIVRADTLAARAVAKMGAVHSPITLPGQMLAHLFEGPNE